MWHEDTALKDSSSICRSLERINRIYSNAASRLISDLYAGLSTGWLALFFHFFPMPLMCFIFIFVGDHEKADAFLFISSDRRALSCRLFTCRQTCSISFSFRFLLSNVAIMAPSDQMRKDDNDSAGGQAHHGVAGTRPGRHPLSVVQTVARCVKWESKELYGPMPGPEI